MVNECNGLPVRHDSSGIVRRLHLSPKIQAFRWVISPNKSQTRSIFKYLGLKQNSLFWLFPVKNQIDLGPGCPWHVVSEMSCLFDENWPSNPQPPNFRQFLIVFFFRGFSKSTEFFNQGWKMVMSYTEWWFFWVLGWFLPDSPHHGSVDLPATRILNFQLPAI